MSNIRFLFLLFQEENYAIKTGIIKYYWLPNTSAWKYVTKNKIATSLKLK